MWSDNCIHNHKIRFSEVKENWVKSIPIPAKYIHFSIWAIIARIYNVSYCQMYEIKENTVSFWIIEILLKDERLELNRQTHSHTPFFLWFMFAQTELCSVPCGYKSGVVRFYGPCRPQSKRSNATTIMDTMWANWNCWI